MYFFLRTTPSLKAKIIIVVSKKVSKKAVTRNGIRRRIRPIVAKFQKDLSPLNYFVTAKPGADKIRGKELELEIKKLFKL